MSSQEEDGVEDEEEELSIGGPEDNESISSSVPFEDQDKEESDYSQSEAPAGRRRSTRSSTKRSSVRSEGLNDSGSPAKKRRQEKNDESEQVQVESVHSDSNDPGDDEQANDNEEDAETKGSDTADASSSHFPRASLNVPGKCAEAGVIKAVYVENFMCHAKFHIELCRNVNFISGANGSGKSAILAAVQICLGAGARRTHRAKNLKDLVRDAPGVTQAKVRVTLLNMGGDGYKHDLYGDEISIERTITTKGGYNGYKLYSKDMKEISRRKKDLDEMLDVLNVQVDNPVAVLDQEESKKFLTGKAEDKFAFFMKATDLERISRIYASTVDTTKDLQHTHDSLTASLEPLEQNIKKLQDRWSEHQELGRLEKKYSTISLKYGWAFFTEAEETYKSSVEKMEKFQQKAQDKRDELSQAESAAQTPSDERDNKAQRIKDLSTEAQHEAQRKKELEDKLHEKLGPRKMYERQLKQTQKEHRQAVQELKIARKRLKEARDEIAAQAGNAESEAVKRNDQLRKAEEDLEEVKSQKDTLRQNVSDALRKYEELEPAVKVSKQKVEHAKNQLHNARSTVQTLSSDSSDSLAVFGPRVSKVHSLIQQAMKKGEFRGQVMGPIGSYIKINPGKEKYAGLAELAIGTGILGRFVFSDNQDRSLFMNIRKKAGCSSDCGSFQIPAHSRYNVPPPPDKDIETVASVLNISEDLVFNCLVDFARIDLRALSAGKEESEAKLLLNNNGAYKTKGVIQEVFFLPHGDRWSVRNGNISLISNEKKPRNMIGADKGAALEQAQNEVTQLTSEIKDLDREVSRLEQEHTSYQREWNRAKKEMNRNDRQINELGETVDALKSEISNSTTRTFDTSEYENDVTVAEDKVESCKTMETTIIQKTAELEPAITELEENLDEASARNAKILNDLRKAEDELTLYLDTQSQQQDILNKKRRKVQLYEEAIAKHNVFVEEHRGAMDQALEKARRLMFNFHEQERAENDDVNPDDLTLTDPTAEQLNKIEIIRPEHSLEYYQARLKKAEEKIQAEKKRRKMQKEDSVSIKKKLDEAEEEVVSKQAQLFELKDQISVLQNDLNARKRLFEKFFRHLMKTTRAKFSDLLSTNRCTGDVHFDRAKGTLDLVVQKESEAETQTKDVKALSGGERSLATVCLLIALGESLETPFRIMDEFDVFLDTHVRKMVIDALIHLAMTMKHRQFIFITPQDLTGLKTNDMVTLLKLTPPKRTNGKN